ncbi:hypothetical protein N864_11670 [Intrasporangium chromatireducens Q5-1]|uniref:Uncharacterized protein n=1 Tax=Intrasporangium chromatireducens Q5-1 TaxID=584657 RepID=W9GSI4_9MICO|nr:DUF6308 family protein [Intrasporangium chromatireducens]EWT07992.1 hypothetical protein N864_11670 [Intrasporangium chromatireducens Q5-1]
MPTDTILVPKEWPVVDVDVVDQARSQALTALSSHGTKKPVEERLAAFYDVSGNYAGASFASLPANDTQDVTAADLHAVSLLSVDIGPAATRRLLDSGHHRNAVLESLAQLPQPAALATAGGQTLKEMESFYTAVKSALSSTTAKKSNPWVTASKLCARKRPGLFPVRDNNVCSHLGILKLNDFRLDWQVFRSLLQEEEINERLETLPGEIHGRAQGRELRLDTSPLRLLDAALWTYTVWS